MKAVPRFLYLLCFVGLATTAALALNGAVQPSISQILLRAVIVAAFCGAPGLIHRKLWPLAIVLLPVGAYLLLRTIAPIPSSVEGMGGQYHFYVEQLRLGGLTYASRFFPLSLEDAPELRLLLAFIVYCLTGLAAFVALSLRRPIPAIVLTLVLLGFGLTVDAAPRIAWLALLFLVLAACLLVFSRGLKRRGWRLRDALVGGAVGVVGSGLALLLLAAAPAAVATPWRDWRAWDPFTEGEAAYGFNWLQNYPELLDPGNNVTVMRVESPSESYWKANALDSFTGRAWTASQDFPESLEPSMEDRSYVYFMPETKPTPKGEAVIETFRVRSVYTNYLFVGGEPQSLKIDRSISLRTNDLHALHVEKALGPALDYSVTAVIPKLKPTDLVGKGSEYPETLNRYLALPFPRVTQLESTEKEVEWRSTIVDSAPGGWEWADLYILNQEIIDDATDPYEKTLRIEGYLRSNFEYSLNPRLSDYSSPYAAFLFDTRAGYCQHFAGAMALLLRYNGVPARVAVGFTSGSPDGEDAYLVSTNNAHAWTEAYFPQVGWVAFDPTPGRNIPIAGASLTSPNFINPFVTSTPSAPTTVTTEHPRPAILDGGQTTGQTGGGRGWASRAAWLPWVVGLVAIFVGWPLMRGLWWRRQVRHGPLEQRILASLGLLRRDLSDYGVATSPSHTLEETLTILQTHLGLAPDPTLIERADAVLFGGCPAIQTDLDRAETLRHEVRTGLRRRHGWLRAALTWYGVPRSVSARRE